MVGGTGLSRDARAVSAPEQVCLHEKSTVSGVYQSFPVPMVEETDAKTLVTQKLLPHKSKQNPSNCWSIVYPCDQTTSGLIII